MGNIIKVKLSQLKPTKRMDVLESHYKDLGERPELVPRFAKFVRHVIHYGVYEDRGEQKPVKVIPEEEEYLIVKGHASALAYHVLGMPIPLKLITPYDLMRDADRGNLEETRRAKNRFMQMHYVVKSYRKECASRGINTLDDMITSELVNSFFEQSERAREETRSRTIEYDTRRIQRRVTDRLPEPSFSDIEVTGIECESKEGVVSAKKIIFDYLKRRNGKV